MLFTFDTHFLLHFIIISNCQSFGLVFLVGWTASEDGAIPFVFRAERRSIGPILPSLPSISLTSSRGNFSIHFRLTLRAEISSSCILSNFAPSLALPLCLSKCVCLLSSFLLLPSFKGSHIYDLSSAPPPPISCNKSSHFDPFVCLPEESIPIQVRTSYMYSPKKRSPFC